MPKIKTEKSILNFVLKKNPNENIELTPEQVKIMENIPIPPEFKNKRLYCRVWNEDGTRTLRKAVKAKYGQPFFTAKIGGLSRYFKINYETKGFIKVIDGKMFYDCAFDNTVGAFALGNREFPEDMDSAEAFTVFKDNAVNMYVKKGGIPLLYLLFAMVAVIVMAIAIVATVPAGLSAQENVKDLDAQVTTLKQEKAVLQQQLNNLIGAR